MRKYAIIYLIVVLFILTTIPANADMTLFVSGDSNIANPLTGNFPLADEDAGNKQFFSNILQGGSSVALLQNSATGSAGYAVPDIDEYYQSIGVSTSIISGNVTFADLSVVDLFFVVLPDNDLTPSEIVAMHAFLASGGDIFFLGENSNFPNENARINNALTGLGSSLSIVNDLFDSGFNHQAQIASDPYTAGVSTFSYGAPSSISGGTTLFYGTGVNGPSSQST